MSAMKEECFYFCGPYKDYCGRAEYDDEAEIFHGEVAGTRDVVTFQGRTPAELRRAFRESVDDYLEFCAELGKTPDKPFSGKFVTRLEPVLHKKISMMADAAGKSLNQFVCDCLYAAANGAASVRTTGHNRQSVKRSVQKAG
ncbi:MAG TPA: type II toxin-antitoxin system HicB family antitoxin [Pirellulaceae bacterium]|jgi:predicted HicB family RNase H-like nuclease